MTILAITLASGCSDDGNRDEAAYIAAIAPTFPDGNVPGEDYWIENGDIACDLGDATLAQIRLEDIERQNERTVRTDAAVRHLCPDRLPTIENPEDFINP